MIEANKIRGHAFGIYGKTLDLASYDSIGVYLQIRLRDFAIQISKTLASISFFLIIRGKHLIKLIEAPPRPSLNTV